MSQESEKKYEFSLSDALNISKTKFLLGATMATSVGAARGYIIGNLGFALGQGYCLASIAAMGTFQFGSHSLRYLRQKEDDINYIVPGILAAVSSMPIIGYKKGVRAGIALAFCGFLFGRGNDIYDFARYMWLYNRKTLLEVQSAKPDLPPPLPRPKAPSWP